MADDPSPPHLQPRDPGVWPRFTDIATLLRAPRLDDLDQVDIGLLGIPIDTGMGFRTGTREGPLAAREASRYIRPTNASTGVSPSELVNVADVGDVRVNPLDLEQSIDRAQAFVANLVDRGVAPVAVGGDHGIALPMLRAIGATTPVGIIQVDSHTDYIDVFFEKKIGHATWLYRAVEEGLVDPHRVIQIGIRGTMFPTISDQASRDAGITVVTYDDYEELGRAAVIDLIKKTVGEGPTYITFDVDGLDPVAAPATAAPEPGGLSVRDAQVILRSLTGLNIVGGDVNELLPALDTPGMTTGIIVANLLFELVCLVAVAKAGTSVPTGSRAK